MTAIILTSIACFVSFIVFIILGIILVSRAVNKRNVVGPVIGTAAAFFIMCGLGTADTVLIVKYIYDNRGKIVEAGVQAGADVVSKGLVKTFTGIVENWDAEVLERLKKVDVAVEKTRVMSEKSSSTGKTVLKYEINAVFTNSNDEKVRISIDDMICGNYLLVGDADGFVYGVAVSQTTTSNLPIGKSKALLTAEVGKGVKLTTLRLGKKTADIKAE